MDESTYWVWSFVLLRLRWLEIWVVKHYVQLRQHYLWEPWRKKALESWEEQLAKKSKRSGSLRKFKLHSWVHLRSLLNLNLVARSKSNFVWVLLQHFLSSAFFLLLIWKQDDFKITIKTKLVILELLENTLPKRQHIWLTHFGEWTGTLFIGPSFYSKIIIVTSVCLVSSKP